MNDALPLGALLLPLWDGRRRIVAAALIGVLLAVVVGHTAPLRYASEGLLLPAPPGERIDDARAEATEKDVLLSRALLADTVARLGLGEASGLVPARRLPGPVEAIVAAAGRTLRALAPGAGGAHGGAFDGRVSDGRASDAALDYVEAHLALGSHENSRVLSLSFTAGDPALAAAVVNAVMRSYVARDLSARRDLLLGPARWLEAEVARTRADADAADADLRRYRSSRKLLTLEAGTPAALELSSERGELADAERALAQARTVEAEDRAALSGGDAARSTPDMLSSPLIAALRGREADLLQSDAELDRLGSSNPRRQALADALAAIRGRIGAEIGKIEASAGHDVAQARDRVATLRTLLDRSVADADASGDAQVVMARMTSDVEAKQALYRDALGRAEAASLAANAVLPAEIVSAAVPPTAPERSHLAEYALLGGVGGALLASSLILLRQLLLEPIRSAPQLAAVTGRPNLGTVPALGKRRRHLLEDLLTGRAEPAVAETMRGLRLALQQSGEGLPLSVMVTSASPGEGKSTIAAALALRAALDGLRVLLVECDLHRPVLARMLGLAASQALPGPDFPADETGARVFVEERSGLVCLLALEAHENPSRALGGGYVARLLEAYHGRFDLVLLDTPPVLSVSDPLVLADEVDRVVFTVAAGRTRRLAVAEAFRRFPAGTRRRTATLLNRSRIGPMDVTGHYTGYLSGRRPALAPARALRGIAAPIA